MEKTYDINKSIKAQHDYQEDKGLPDFAPDDGKCWRCKKNIYQALETLQDHKFRKTGICVEEAGSELITGCPHCNYSFCS